MAFSIRIYGTVDSFPSMDELIEILEESDFEVTLETEDEEGDEENWTELLIFESSLDGPISVYRLVEPDILTAEVDKLKETLGEYEESPEGNLLLNVFENCAIGFGIEAPEEIANDDNTLLLSSLVAQILAQRTDGVYSVDSEGFFNENGELIFELASEE